MRSYDIVKSAGLLVLLALSTGCVSMQPLSNYARTGDTVAVAIGGTHSNALVSVLKKDNISATITDSVGNTYPVKLRNLFRVYSDPSSGYQYLSTSGMDYYENFVGAHQGQWIAVLDLVDPASNSPPTLAAGMARIAVSSPDLLNFVDYTGFNFTWANGQLDNIPIEILPGTGTRNPLNYMPDIAHHPLDSLEPLPQIEVSVSGSPSTLVGGAFYVFRYSQQAVYSTQEPAPQVTLTTPDRHVQLASHHALQSDGSTLLTVTIANPQGFNATKNLATLRQGGSWLRDMRFSLVWSARNSLVTDANWQSVFQLVSARYVDINGNPMPELTPALAKVR